MDNFYHYPDDNPGKGKLKALCIVSYVGIGWSFILPVAVTIVSIVFLILYNSFKKHMQ